MHLNILQRGRRIKGARVRGSLRGRGLAGGEIESQMKALDTERRSKAKERNGDLSRGLLLRLELPSDPSLLCAVRGAVERLTE